MGFYCASDQQLFASLGNQLLQTPAKTDQPSDTSPDRSFRWRAGGAPHSYRRVRQPSFVKHLFCEAMVHIRADKLFIRIGNLLVFVFAVLGPFFRQMSLLHEVAEKLRIGAKGDTEHIVKALRGRAVRVCELRHRERCRCGVRLGLMGVGDASDQPSRLGLPELSMTYADS